MQIRLILPLGVLLSSCLSAAAQTPTTQFVLIREPSAPLLMLVQVVPAQLPPVPFSPAQPAGKTTVSLTARLARTENPGLGLMRLLSVDVVKTMFITESGVPLFQLPGGRLQLNGFASTHHLGNVLLGPPSGLGHPGVWVPRPAWVYGISLRFRLGRNAQMERPTRRMAASRVNGGRRS